MGKCLDCKNLLPVGAGKRRKYCDNCIKARQVKAGKSKKGVPYLPSSYHTCLNCGGTFMAKADTARTLCNSCTKARNIAHYNEVKPKIDKGIRNYKEVRGMWYTCECGSAVTWRNTHINREGTKLTGVEKCNACGREKIIDVPVTEYCTLCKTPLIARKGTKVKYCAECSKKVKLQDITTYLNGLVGIDVAELVILHRHSIMQKLKELDKLL